MATRRAQWPTSSEWARMDSIERASRIKAIGTSALVNLELADQMAYSDPQTAQLGILRARAKIAEITALAADIQLLLTEAKNGHV